LTDDELKRLAAAAENPRDVAILLVDFENGGRIGEVLSCLIKHVSFDNVMALFAVVFAVDLVLAYVLARRVLFKISKEKAYPSSI
jgi:integrase